MFFAGSDPILRAYREMTKETIPQEMAINFHFYFTKQSVIRYIPLIESLNLFLICECL